MLGFQGVFIWLEDFFLLFSNVLDWVANSEQDGNVMHFIQKYI